MFNPQTADWGKLALWCRKWHYNAQLAKREQYPFLAWVFYDEITKHEWEKRYGTTRANL